MLTSMNTSDAATILRKAREDSGLSIRELARRAGVAGSTITRIESGEIDPTFDVLRRILSSANKKIVIAAQRAQSAPGPRLANLSDAWRRADYGDEPDWTRLRAFLDWLALEPECARQAIRQRPHSESSVMNALLAGIAEKIADDADFHAPSWTRRVPPLPFEWSAPGTPRMKERWRRTVPPQLEERGLLVDAESLWRDRNPVSV